jgi:hypothetical protein
MVKVDPEKVTKLGSPGADIVTGSESTSCLAGNVYVIRWPCITV